MAIEQTTDNMLCFGARVRKICHSAELPHIHKEWPIYTFAFHGKGSAWKTIRHWISNSRRLMEDTKSGPTWQSELAAILWRSNAKEDTLQTELPMLPVECLLSLLCHLQEFHLRYNLFNKEHNWSRVSSFFLQPVRPRKKMIQKKLKLIWIMWKPDYWL